MGKIKSNVISKMKKTQVGLLDALSEACRQKSRSSSAGLPAAPVPRALLVTESEFSPSVADDPHPPVSTGTNSPPDPARESAVFFERRRWVLVVVVALLLSLNILSCVFVVFHYPTAVETSFVGEQHQGSLQQLTALNSHLEEHLASMKASHEARLALEKEIARAKHTLDEMAKTLKR